MFDCIDFNSEDDNTINMWYCVRDYLDDDTDYDYMDSSDIKVELELLSKNKNLSNGNLDTRIVILKKK